MFNRSEILRDAWLRYQAWAGDAGGRFDRKVFSWSLKAAWRSAKDHAAMVELVADEPAYSPRATEIHDELRAMEFSDVGVNWDRHRNLTAELFRLSATNVGGASHAA